MEAAAGAPEYQARRGVAIIRITADHLDRVVYDADDAFHFKAGEEVNLWIEGIDLPEDMARFTPEQDELLLIHHNAYVNTGLNNSLDREFGLGGAAVADIGLDSDTSAVTAATTLLHGSATSAPATTLNGAVSAGATTFVVASGANIQVGMGFVIQAGTGTIEAGVVGNIAGTTVTLATSTGEPAGQLLSAHATGTTVNFSGQSIKGISPAATRTNQTTTGGATWTYSGPSGGGDFQLGTPSLSAPFVMNKIGFLNTATDAGTGLIDVIGGTGAGIYSRSFKLDLTNAGNFTAILQIAVTAVAV